MTSYVGRTLLIVRLLINVAKIIKSIEPNKSTYKIKMGQIDPFRHQRYLI